MKQQFLTLTICFGLLLSSCGNETSGESKTAIKSCNININELTRTETTSGQTNVYVSAKGFNSKNKECWNAIKEYAYNVTTTAGNALIVHFMDTDQFTPPSDGKFYGSESETRKVIAQFSVTAQGVESFDPDPMGYGNYVEEK